MTEQYTDVTENTQMQMPVFQNSQNFGLAKQRESFIRLENFFLVLWLFFELDLDKLFIFKKILPNMPAEEAIELTL